MTKLKKLQNNPSVRKPVNLIILSLIIGLGAVLRLWNLETKMRFIWDEGRDMSAIRHMLVNRDLTLLGPMNEIGGKIDFFGVFHYYLMAPALWLTNYQPIGPAVLTALLGIACLPLVFILIKKWSNQKIALMTTGLYSISPLVIKYVRWPWNPNTTPFFGLLFCLAVTQLQITKKLIWSFISGFLLGLLFQLHYLSVFIGWFWGINWLFFSTWKTKINHGLIFGLGFLLPNLTFVVFELRHKFFLSKILLASFTGGTQQQFFKFSWLNLFKFPITFTGNTISNLFWVNSNEIVSFILGTGVLGFLIYRFATLIKKRTVTLELGIIASWLAFLFVGVFVWEVIDEYHAANLWFGLIFILSEKISWFIHELKFFSQKTKIIFLIVTVAIIIGAELKSSPIFEPPLWSENLPKLRKLSLIIAEDAKKLNPDQPFNIATFTDADTKGIRYRYFLEVFGVKPEGVDVYTSINKLYVISLDSWDKLIQRNVWEINSFKTASMTKLGKVGNVEVFRLDKVK